LFNNQIYGLTKGQYSPTSEMKKVTKSTPFGSIDHPFNPWPWPWAPMLPLLPEHGPRPQTLQEALVRSQKHKGASFLEIYQNCNIFMTGLRSVYRKIVQTGRNPVPGAWQATYFRGKAR